MYIHEIINRFCNQKCSNIMKVELEIVFGDKYKGVDIHLSAAMVAKKEDKSFDGIAYVFIRDGKAYGRFYNSEMDQEKLYFEPVGTVKNNALKLSELKIRKKDGK